MRCGCFSHNSQRITWRCTVSICPWHFVQVLAMFCFAIEDWGSVWGRTLCAVWQLVQQEENLQPGDEIDVLGFPAYGSFSPMLEDALFQKTGAGPPPTPRLIASATNAFDFEDDLIATEAILTDVQTVFEGTALALKSGGTIFRALLKSPPDYKSNPDWQPGSKVRVTGICSVIHDDVRPLMGIWQPQAFQILLRSPADLRILNRPPWWTPQHVFFSWVSSLADCCW